MPLSIKEYQRQLRPYLPADTTSPAKTLAQAINRSCPSASNGLWLAPGGDFAAYLAQDLQGQGLKVKGLFDNFKKPGRQANGLLIQSPKDLSPEHVAPIIIATPSPSLQEDLRDQFLDLIPQNKENIFTLYDLFPQGLEDLFHQIRQQLARRPKPAPPTKTICVATSYLHHNYLKLLHALKAEGYYVILLTGSPYLNGTLSIADFADGNFFDWHLSSPLFEVFLPKLVTAIDPDLVHAIITTAPAKPIARLTRQAPCPVIADYCDFKEIIFTTDAEYLQTMDAQQLATEKWAWRTIYNQCTAIIYKDSPEILRHLQHKYHHPAPKPQLQFMSYPTREFLPTTPKVRGSQQRPLQIVYAGAVINNPDAHAYLHHRSLLTIARALAQHGIAFTIYNAIDHGNTAVDFPEYLDLATSEPLFNYHQAVGQDQLASILNQYDLGWFAFDFSQAKESPFFFATTFGSKIFNYMEAGLPSLVPQECAYMAKWVEQRGIGKAISCQDMPSLCQQLDRLDITKLHHNIEIRLPGFLMEQQQGRLSSFYTKVITSSCS